MVIVVILVFELVIQLSIRPEASNEALLFSEAMEAAHVDALNTKMGIICAKMGRE